MEAHLSISNDAVLEQAQSPQVKIREFNNLDAKPPQLHISKSSLGPCADQVTCMFQAIVLASEHIFRPEVNLMRIAYDVLEHMVNLGIL